MTARRTTKKSVAEKTTVEKEETQTVKAPELIELLPELVDLMTAQLTEDYKRWGETWKRRPRLNQEFRVYNRIKAYKAEYERTGAPMPWLKVIGNAWIAIVRENHPDLLASKDTGKNELIELLPELVEILTKRLEVDYEEKGDAWKGAWPVTDHILARYQKYLTDYVTAGVAIPWDKVIGNAWIAVVKQKFAEKEMPPPFASTVASPIKTPGRVITE
jgi:hypothetical protein